jgi:chromosome partitioning protein
MKILVLANQKGGVGKSAIACQFALFLALKSDRNVLVIDLDHQANASDALQKSTHVAVSEFRASALFHENVRFPAERFLLVPADRDLLRLESQAANHDVFLNNFVDNVRDLPVHYDYVVIDTGPNPDIRPLSALIAADFVISPIQLNQEAIDGLSALQVDLEKMRSLNPNLRLLGALPNIVLSTPFQKENWRVVSEAFPDLFLRMEKNGPPARIKQSQAIAEAQAEGLGVFESRKPQSRAVWKEIEPVFDRMLGLMNGAQ